MAFPAIGTTTFSESATDTRAHSVALGSPTAGELVLVIAAIDGVPSVIDVDEAISGHGWHSLGSDSHSTNATGAAWWKIAEGADALTFRTDDSERAKFCALRITGHGSAVTAATAAGSATNADPPSVTQSGSAQDTLFIAAACIDAQVVASAAPAGYSNLQTSAHSNAGGASVSLAEYTANATTENPGAFTTTTEQWVAWTFAIASTAITTNARASQVAVETLSDGTPAARVSQLAVEVLSLNAVTALITQIAVEVLSPYEPDTGQPARQLQINC